MKELIFISAQPDDIVFSWQIELFIESVRQVGYSNQIQILLYVPPNRIKTGPSHRFKELEARYRKDNVRFFWYPDSANLLSFGIEQSNYVPLLRPHCLKKHFYKYPELKEKVLFYHDSDIIFTQKINLEPFLQDDTCYMSNTGGYLGVHYFNEKITKVKNGLKEQFLQIDVLDTCAKLIGINRQICEKNDQSTGGAQYILKNIDGDFWEDVELGTYKLRRYLNYDLGGINSKFFNSEKEGIQSWCSDMWALLWNLWKRNIPTATPASLNFCWATDPIAKWQQTAIYHDAGVNETNEHYLFNKKSPSLSLEKKLPYECSHAHVSDQFCSYNYIQQIEHVKQTYYHEESIC